MTYTFGLIAVGAILLVSATKNQSILETLSGVVKGPTQKPLENLPSKGGSGNDGQAEKLGADRGGSSSGVLLHLAQIARDTYHLKVTEFKPWGLVHPVHAPDSYHYKGRAFDASGSYKNMNAFAAYLRTNYSSQLTEGIHNPGLSVKNGKAVAPGFWGISTWMGHANHVHVAV